MRKSSVRTLGSQLGLAVGGAVVAIALTGGSFAFAQDAPEAGGGVAEALAGPNTVNSAAIINGAVTGQDVATATIGRGDIKPGVAPLYAKVDADAAAATMLSAKGATSVTFISNGSYKVTFNRSVVGCGWTATRNDNDAGGVGAGEIAVERDSAGDAFSLRVRTFNSAGALVAPDDSDGFTVQVVC